MANNNLTFKAVSQSAEFKIAGMIGRKLKASDFKAGDVQGRHEASQSKPFAMYYCASEDKFWQANINDRSLPVLPSRASFEASGFFWPLSAGDKSLKVTKPIYESAKSYVHIANGLVAWLASNVDAEFVGVELFDTNAEFRAFVQKFAAKDKACNEAFRLPVSFGSNITSYSFLDALRDLVSCSAVLEPVFADGKKKRTSVNIKTKYRVSQAWREVIASLKPHYESHLA